MSNKELRYENDKRISKTFQENYKKMKNYANSFLYNSEESEDIVSDVITNLIEKPNINTWDENGGYSISYIMVSIKNRCINKLAKNNNITQREFYDNLNIEDEPYDVEKDKYFEEANDLLISIINETKTKRIDKYADSYIKHKLYQTPIKTITRQRNLSSTNTIYTHFKIINNYVIEEFNTRSVELQKKLLL